MFCTVKRLLLVLTCSLWLCLPGYGQELIREIPAPSSNPTGLCWDGTALWVSDYSQTIYRVDPEDGSVLSTITGPTVGSDGLAWDGEALWTLSRVSSNQNIYRISASDGTVLDTVPDPSGWGGGLTWSSEQIWMSVNWPTGRLIAISSSTELPVDTIQILAEEPYGLAFDGTSIWISSEDSDADRIYRYDEATEQFLWSFELPEHQPSPGRRPRGLAWDGQYLWIVAYQENGWNLRILQYDVGNADNPDIELTDVYHSFGAHVIGYPVEWSTEIHNIGNVPLILDSAVWAVGDGYLVIDPAVFPVSVGPESSTGLTIRFDPPVAGQLLDTLLLYSNDPDEDPSQIAVVGEGLLDEGDIDVSPNQVNFGVVHVGFSTGAYVELWNLGAGVLQIDTLSIEGDEEFTIDEIEFPQLIDSSSHLTIRVWYRPQMMESNEAELLIVSDDIDEDSIHIPLEGTTDDPEFEGGELIWYFQADNIDWDISLNAVTWINDVNGDGIADVVAASANHLIYCLNGGSNQYADTLWTYDTGADPNHSGIVFYERGLSTCSDLTGDGVDEVIIGTTGNSQSVIAIDGVDGTELWSFSSDIWGGGWIYEAHAAGDLNGDGLSEVLGAVGGSDGGGRRIFAVNGANGSLLWDGPPTEAYFSVRPINDVNGDGIPEVVGGNTDGRVIGIDGSSGSSIWEAIVGQDSPVFALVAMGNANPAQTTTEDVAVASAYSGTYCLDGGNGARIWFQPAGGTIIYEIQAGDDITGDDVREVYVGTVNGRLICYDGADGTELWQTVVNPAGAENILSTAVIPDISGDDFADIVSGTLGDYTVVSSGFDGDEIWSTLGLHPDAVDAVSVLPDIDENGSWEILSANRSGVLQVLSGGILVPPVPRGELAGEVRVLPSLIPIEDALVTVEETGQSAVTDHLGNYSMVLDTGTYSVTFSKIGLCDTTYSEIVIFEDNTTVRNAAMYEAGIESDVTSVNEAVESGESTSVEFSILNVGHCEVEFESRTTVDWITTDPQTGVIGEGGAQPIELTLDAASLEPGDYQTILYFDNDASEQPLSLLVSLVVTVDVDGQNGFIPKEFALYQNYPNPFNPSTVMKFDVPKEARVQIIIYDVLGRETARPVDSYLSAGRHRIRFEADALPSGMYLVRMNAGDFTAMNKMVVLK